MTSGSEVMCRKKVNTPWYLRPGNMLVIKISKIKQQQLTQKGTLTNDVLHVLAVLGLEAGGGRVKGVEVVLLGRLEQEGGGELGGRPERVEQEREGEGEVGGAEAGRGRALRGAGEQQRREEVEEEGEAGGRGERRRRLARAH